MKQKSDRSMSLIKPLLMKGELRASPWDEAVLGVPCYEILKLDDQLLAQLVSKQGHYTIKVSPLSDKKVLHVYGFYYVDTLIEPYADIESIESLHHPQVALDQKPDLEPLLRMCEHNFLHGRFHRDFHVSPDLADRRYQQWLTQLYQKKQVVGLCYQGKLVGFIAYDGGQLLLHALDRSVQGKGLAKFFWSQTIALLGKQRVAEISSSISATNMPVLNLYRSLGFKFRQPQDVYHCWVEGGNNE